MLTKRKQGGHVGREAKYVTGGLVPCTITVALLGSHVLARHPCGRRGKPLKPKETGLETAWQAWETVETGEKKQYIYIKLLFFFRFPRFPTPATRFPRRFL